MWKLLVCTAAVAALAGCEKTGLTMAQAKDYGAMEDAAAGRSPLTGKPAPDFALPDQDGHPVTLGKLRDKWVVLYFYPKDDTPGCTCEATEFTGLVTHFRDMNAVVIGVSPDPPGLHRQFILAYKIKLTLLSDPDHKVMEPYGAWAHSALAGGTYGRVVRSTVIIDPRGAIRYHWPEVIPRGHADRVRQKLAELQAADAAKQAPTRTSSGSPVALTRND